MLSPGYLDAVFVSGKSNNPCELGSGGVGGGGVNQRFFYEYVMYRYYCTADYENTVAAKLHNGTLFHGIYYFSGYLEIVLRGIWGPKKSWPSPNIRYRKCPIHYYVARPPPQKKITIYAPMIYTAPCVTLLMRAASITRANGRGLGPGNRVFGPCKMASFLRCLKNSQGRKCAKNSDINLRKY